MFVLFHKRVCGSVARSLFERKPNAQYKRNSKIESAYYDMKLTLRFRTFSTNSLWPPGTERILRDKFSEFWG